MAAIAQLPTPDSHGDRRLRGAFFTPEVIAKYMSAWAIGDRSTVRVLDPSCGDGAFLNACGALLSEANLSHASKLVGIDIHEPSLTLLKDEWIYPDIKPILVRQDFYNIPAPETDGDYLFDAVVGNPPYIRFQKLTSSQRVSAKRVAEVQGVALSGMASSWASFLVHASGFLKSDGRLAMVLPTELLSVDYAQSVRTWLKERFEQVHLITIARNQFAGVDQAVVLLLASGTGGCDAFSLYALDDAAELASIRPMSNLSVTPETDSKWTDLFLPSRVRTQLRSTRRKSFVPLSSLATAELGTVTGRNSFFLLSERRREEFGLVPGLHVRQVLPTKSKYFAGFGFSLDDWNRALNAGESAWLLDPAVGDNSPKLLAYLRTGLDADVHRGFKCSRRTFWWKPAVVPPPDLFFTYMSHLTPRLVSNNARVTFVNSLHGVRFLDGVSEESRLGLPYLAMNSVTMLAAELEGRSHGGGVLKLEPRELLGLPVPTDSLGATAWRTLSDLAAELDAQAHAGETDSVRAIVDDILLGETLGISASDIRTLSLSVLNMRDRRLSRRRREVDSVVHV